MLAFLGLLYLFFIGQTSTLKWSVLSCLLTLDDWVNDTLMTWRKLTKFNCSSTEDIQFSTLSDAWQQFENCCKKWQFNEIDPLTLNAVDSYRENHPGVLQQHIKRESSLSEKFHCVHFLCCSHQGVMKMYSKCTEILLLRVMEIPLCRDLNDMWPDLNGKLLWKNKPFYRDMQYYWR